MSLPEFGFDPRNPGHLEKSLIGTAILDPDVLEMPEVRALQPHHFAHYGGLWQLVREVQATGNLGLVALAEYEHDPRWPVGMTLYDLASLDAYSLQPRELPAVARGVLSTYRSTEAHRSAAVLARTLSEPEADALGAITTTHARLGELLGETPSSSTVSVADDLNTAIDRLLNPAKYRGVTTGLTGYDAVLGGWQPRTLNILAARPSMGKALRNDQRVLTPKGWVAIGGIAVGDQVYGSDGKPTAVLGVYPQGAKETYMVKMIDGASVITCAEHLWTTRTKCQRKQGHSGSVVSTAQIAATLRYSGQHNHTIDFVQPIQYPVLPLPLDPWLLGFWLGDGCADDHSVRLSNVESDLLQKVREALKPYGDELVSSEDGKNHRINRHKNNRGKRTPGATKAAIERLGLIHCRANSKFIPEIYMRASVQQRLELFRGLADSDGFVTDPAGMGVEISTVSEKLRDGIVELARSLGGRTAWSSKIPTFTNRGEKHSGQLAYRITVSFPVLDAVPVSSVKHLKKWRGDQRQRGAQRAIVAVEPAGQAECTCITVAAADALFVTEGYILTHNSAIVGQFAQSAALGDQRGPGRVLMFSLEDGAMITRQRTLSRMSGVDLRHDAAPMVGAEHRLKQAAATLETMRSRWMIDEEGSLEGIVSACWREHAAAPLDLIIIDQLSHVRASAPRGQADNRTQLYGYITKTLKQDVAKRLGVPVLLVSQLSREVTKRGDNRPDLPDLRDSGEIEQDADTVTFIHRPDYYDPADSPGQAELIVRKNRNGPTKTVHLNANLRLFKFEEAPR